MLVRPAARRSGLAVARLLQRHSSVARATRNNSSAAATSVTPKLLNSILIANRGEIALRVGRTAAEHGVRTTTLYTDPDATSQHALSSAYAVNLGEPSEYLNGSKIIQVAKEQGCDSIHPGYGFLSENSGFAKQCQDAGIKFIGPPWEAIEAMGNKSRSKEIMLAAGVPCIPGYHGNNQDPQYLLSEAEKIQFPVLLKAVKGGGGKGMRISRSADDFLAQLESAKMEARNSFGDDTMLVEKYITTPRHIEVQVFADQHGNCVALGERDCSIQRRHQKIIEESPAPHLDETVRQDLWEKARAAALAVGYEGAGTVEFIFDNDSGEFFFMEMNTRLQVEHPVTEMVTGQDLVQWQIMIAQGEKLPLTQEEIARNISERGWAFEARIYAENPDMNFVPDSGRLLHLRLPPTSQDVRVDAGFVAGDEISSFYDPMIAKLIVRGSTREAALAKLHAALNVYEIAGPVTNIEFLKRICVSKDFVDGKVETGYIEKHHEDLFHKDQVLPEVWANAALAGLLQETQSQTPLDVFVPSSTVIGFGSGSQQRSFNALEILPDGTTSKDAVKVSILQKGPQTFDITVNEHEFRDVTSTMGPGNVLQTFFPHTRLEATVITDGEKVIIFQQGKQYRLQHQLPQWAEKALGIKDVANSVLAPMPCKILRVDVNEGDTVKKDQALIVIESMKMETVIKSPHDGVISKVVHRQGDICKAGAPLVEFVEESEA